VRNRFALGTRQVQTGAHTDPRDSCPFCADSLGKLKSLYAYPMGIHIIQLIRESVPYTLLPSG
jgi:hypothetical protein